MVISLIHPNTCGFAKVIAWQLSHVARKETTRLEDERQAKYRARVMVEQHRRFVETFSECQGNFAIDFHCFQTKFPGLQQKFTRWNSRKMNERSIYLTTFSIEKWTQLSSSEKDGHSLMECRRCTQGNNYEQSLFPVKSRRFRSISEDNVFVAAKQCVQEILRRKPGKCTEREAVELARKIYNKINPKFEKIYHISFAEALVSIPELNLRLKGKEKEGNNTEGQ